MKLNFLVLQRMPGIDYNPAIGRNAIGGIAFTGANNGTSISSITPGTVVLGQDVGQVGAPAKLLSIREIPLNGFSEFYSGMGLGAPSAALIFQYDATAINSTEPQIIMRNHLGVQIGALRIGESNDSVYLGNNAASANTGIINIMVGGGCGAGQLTMSRCIGIGGGALQGNADGLTNIIAIGNDALDNSGLAVGANIIVIGHNSWDISTGAIGSNNISIGIGSNNSNGSGAIGAQNIVIGHAVNIGGGITNTMLILCTSNGANVCTTSNIVVLGSSTQNTIIGQPVAAAFTDNGTRLQVLGGISLPLRFITVNTTATGADFTIIATVTVALLTIPVASTVVGRIYVLGAQGAAVTMGVSQNITQLTGVNTTTILASTSMMIQASAAGWVQIK